MSNQSKEGKRAGDKRSAASEGLFDTSSEEEDDEEAAEEAVDEEVTMGKSTTAKKAPPETPASAAKAKVSKTELDELCSKFNKVSMYKDNEAGFNFTGMFPYMWYTFVYDGVKYTTYDCLSWTTDVNDLTITVSSDGWKVHVQNKIPAVMFNKRRNQARYGIENEDLSDHLYYQAATEAHDRIYEYFDMQDIAPGMTIQLPYCCVQALVDPYDEDGPGKHVLNLPHPSPLVNHRVCTFTFTVKSNTVPRRKAYATSADYDF